MSEHDERMRRLNTVSHAKKILNSKLPKKTDQDILWEKFQDVTLKIRDHIKPILKAGGYSDRPAIVAMVHTLYIQSLDAFSKDELVSLCSSMASEALMEGIDAAPNGGDKPDLLSGN